MDTPKATAGIDSKSSASIMVDASVIADIKSPCSRGNAAVADLDSLTFTGALRSPALPVKAVALKMQHNAPTRASTDRSLLRRAMFSAQGSSRRGLATDAQGQLEREDWTTRYQMSGSQRQVAATDIKSPCSRGNAAVADLDSLTFTGALRSPALPVKAVALKMQHNAPTRASTDRSLLRRAMFSAQGSSRRGLATDAQGQLDAC
mmetsp:Transcript_10065/g.11077  ORF Transcript_10065/g.11077 Transcript_10065/m.11077 type:complete len:205 (-) Transcript_10065:8-622(-)